MITKGEQKINRITLLKELERYAVFNLKIVGDIIKKDKNYTKLVAYRLKKEGLIFEIERNKYTTKKNSLIAASNIIWPSYISLWTAFRYYNLTEQLPQTIFLITPKIKNKNKINFNNEKIVFIKTKPKYFFGYKKDYVEGYPIFIAEKEKAILDSMLFRKISLLEIYDIIRNNIKNIDIPLLIKYAVKIENKTLLKRIGFMLEELNINCYDRLKRYIDFKYIPLEYALPSKGKKDKKWRIIENVKL